ncbi:MAG: (d)CMP kinase [Christensenellales bacterium]|jgi:cytidylate kinase
MAEIFSIAIDGPSSSGKSTVASAVAKRLGILHVNTGSMYRAVAYYFIKNGLDYNNEKVVNAHLDDIHIEVKFEDGKQADYLNGEYVTPFLRANEVSVGSSVVSQFARVRHMTVEIQREVASHTSCIMEGRDITTVVLPNSKNKFFLTASAEERAKRRFKENLEKGIESNFEQLYKEVVERDQRDENRTVSPLRQAEDAVLIDATNLTVDEVIETVVKNLKI